MPGEAADCVAFWPEPVSVFWLFGTNDAHSSSHVLDFSFSLTLRPPLTLAAAGNASRPPRRSEERRYVVSAASDSTVTSRAGAGRLVRTEPHVLSMSLFILNNHLSGFRPHGHKSSSSNPPSGRRAAKRGCKYTDAGMTAAQPTLTPQPSQSHPPHTPQTASRTSTPAIPHSICALTLHPPPPRNPSPASAP